MIIFRTNTSSSIGIGHLARCRRLAVSLKSNRYEVCFALDYVNDYLKEYLKGFTCYGVYSLNESFSEEKDDAMRFFEYFGEKKVIAVVVDDYRFSSIWEELITRLDCKVIVLDDQDKNIHQCNLLIDSSWEGDKTFQRYKGKVSNNATCLLGPKYLLIDKLFSTNKKREHKALNKNQPIRILLSLGGGGDLILLISLIKHFIDKPLNDLHYEITTIIGPYATNKDEFIVFSKKYDEVKIILNQDGLFNEISKSDLYIGASGGTLFEALAMQIPCITFSISENQQNDHVNFEDLGHYFHLNEITESDLANFALLVWEILSQYQRIYNLYQNPSTFKIDGKGVERVCKAIHSVIIEEPILELGEISKQDEHDLNKGYDLNQINDTAINRYLDARNLKINLDKMIDKNPIPRLNHYLWWLKANKRTSYVLKKNGEELLFIWHQLQKVENKNVIISGWFISNKSCSALDAMHAVTEHSIFIDNLFPGFSWIIVMRSDNYFMQKLHQRLDFRMVDKGSDMERVVQKSFPKADPDDFLYYFKRIRYSKLNQHVKPKTH